jgi:hypothetical protein
MNRKIPFNPPGNGKKSNDLMSVTIGLILAMIAVSSAYATHNNPNGASVDALSIAMDSSFPDGANALGAKVAFAGTDQTGPDLQNPENATAWLGLFDPIIPQIKRNEATDWTLYQ